MRSDMKGEVFVAYTNTSRDDPVEYRYQDPEAVMKLRLLKKRWDPDGCFTKQLLGREL